jgi:predicted nucleotidyltransferase
MEVAGEKCMKLKTDFLPTEVRNEVNKLVERITTEFKDGLLKIIVFGSAARGQLHGESDIDILCLVKKKNLDLFTQMTDIAYDIFLEEGKLLSIKVLEQDRFNYLIKLNEAFAKNILSEGKVVWEKSGNS